MSFSRDKIVVVGGAGGLPTALNLSAKTMSENFHLLAANNAVNAMPPSRIPAAAAGFSFAR